MSRFFCVSGRKKAERDLKFWICFFWSPGDLVSAVRPYPELYICLRNSLLFCMFCLPFLFIFPLGVIDSKKTRRFTVWAYNFGHGAKKIEKKTIIRWRR